MVCPRCGGPNFNRVGSYGRGVKADYFECRNCGYAEDNGKPVKEKVLRLKKCPRCSSRNIEPSWGSEGYYQCNECGAEWRQGSFKKVNWATVGTYKPRKKK